MGNYNNFCYYDASFLFSEVNTHWHNIIKKNEWDKVFFYNISCFLHNNELKVLRHRIFLNNKLALIALLKIKRFTIQNFH